MEESEKCLTEARHPSEESAGEEEWKAGAVNNGRGEIRMAWQGRAPRLRLIRRSEKICKPP